MSSALALLAQATEGNTPSWLKLLWDYQPIFTIIVSLLGLTFSILAFRRAGVRDFVEPLRDYVMEKISDTKSSSDDARNLVEANLTGAGGDAKDSQRAAQQALKKLEIQIDQLQRALECRKDDVFRAWSEWKNVTTGGVFPVSNKTHALKHGAPQLTSIQEAHSKFVCFLSLLEMECLKARPPFWNRFKLKR